MSKLEEDTQICLHPNQDAAAEQFTAILHPDWQVWYPHGGYMAAMLIRAAGFVSTFERPVSFGCHFLSVPEIGSVDIQVRRLRKTRFAESMGLTMTQGDKAIIEALIWTGATVGGYEHDDVDMPSVPSPENLKSTKEIPGGHASEAFWGNLEQRPVTGDVHWLQTKSGPAIQRDWLRFLPDDLDADPYLRMARYAVLLDSFCWPAAARAHCGDSTYIAPTLSLNVSFHRDYSGSWMLSDAHAPTAKDGYISFYNRLWSRNGALLATANGSLMCRPRPG